MPDELKSQYQYNTKLNLLKLNRADTIKNFYSLERGIADYINILKKYDHFSKY